MSCDNPLGTGVSSKPWGANPQGIGQRYSKGESLGFGIDLGDGSTTNTAAHQDEQHGGNGLAPNPTVAVQDCQKAN